MTEDIEAMCELCKHQCYCFNIMKLFKAIFGPGEMADIEIVGIYDSTLKLILDDSRNVI